MSSLTENNDIGAKMKKRARYDDDDDDDDDTLSSETKRDRKEDRLSDLPDCILIHLMTFMTTRDSVRTSVMSTRWKHLWKRVPSLVLHSRDFLPPITPFPETVSQVLSQRDSSVSLHSLDFHYNSLVTAIFLEEVVEYAVSHNIQCLKIRVARCRGSFSPCTFSSQTLRSLDLAVDESLWLTSLLSWEPFVPKSLNLTALTSLRLRGVAFSAKENKLVEPFTSCVNLKTLVIDHCRMNLRPILCISNSTLVNLTIHAPTCFKEEAYKVMLSTPNLCRFTFTGFVSHQLAASNLSRLEEVKIGVNDSGVSLIKPSGFFLMSWLQVFAKVTSLTVTSATLKTLSLIPDLLNTESPCLDNLKSLTVNVKPSSPVPDGVVDYLIRNSPFAKVNIRNCQEGKLGNSAKGELVTAPRPVAEAEQRVEVRRSNRARQSNRRLEGYVL